ncbi:MAG: cation:proton antiporter domain-containing protein [Planctomycetota bacterium]|jgi:predicted Kef-type K+ transport protein
MDHYTDDLIWIGPALVFGLLALRVGLPPMVGYLMGGFILNVVGIADYDELATIGELGVTLLLFTIGLKLDIRSLLKPMIWAGSTIHMVVVVVVFGFGLYLVSLAGLALFTGFDAGTAALVAFALSFSSTVFAVKTLEEKGEMPSRHGKIAIGFLIMQDIFAVLFLAFSTGKVPSVWALGLLALIPGRLLLLHLLTRAGRSEVLILLGLALAFGGYALFNVVNVKGDLGALILGAMLASHPSASAMSKKLMGLKDLLLVGFFLSIGMTGDISVGSLVTAAVLAIVVMVKVGLYFVVMSRFHARARTSVLASLSLANYSEFGLIVGSLALVNGWLSADWLVVVALALTMTFIAAAPLNAISRRVVHAVKPLSTRFESSTILPEDEPIDPGDARIAIVGMPTGVDVLYDTLRERYGDVLVGIDADPEVVQEHQAAGRHAILGDATDEEFWARVSRRQVRVTILAFPEHEEQLSAAKQVQAFGRDEDHRVFAVSDSPGHAEELRAAHVDEVWLVKQEVFRGFVQDVIHSLGEEVRAGDGPPVA